MLGELAEIIVKTVNGFSVEARPEGGFTDRFTSQAVTIER